MTHAHADHATPGHDIMFGSCASVPFLQQRLGRKQRLQGLIWGEGYRFGGVTVSLHPAGHVAGSAQIRVDDGQEVWVVTGDYKRDPDPSCEPFEIVPCDVLITEATFALPVYRWPSGAEVAQQVLSWWRNSAERPSILFGYAFGKTQRLLAELARIPEARTLAQERGVYLHGAATALTQCYRDAGYDLLPTEPAHIKKSSSTNDSFKNEALTNKSCKNDFNGSLILAPPSAHRSPWMKRFHNPQTAFASGWMLVRGARRRRGYERGFVISDHADWPSLIQTVHDSGAQRVLVTHGHDDSFARYLRETYNLDATSLSELGSTAGPWSDDEAYHDVTEIKQDPEQQREQRKDQKQEQHSLTSKESV